MVTPQARPIKKSPAPKKTPTRKEILIKGAGKVVIIAGVIGAFKVFVLDQYFSSSAPYKPDEECPKLADAKDKLDKKIKEIGLDLKEIEEKITSLSG